MGELLCGIINAVRDRLDPQAAQFEMPAGAITSSGSQLQENVNNNN